METLCKISFMILASLQQAESIDCPQPNFDSQDVYVCSAADLANVSTVRLISSSSGESKQCFCDIKLQKATNFSFAYYGPDFDSCGLQIDLENNHFKCQTASLILSLNQSARMTYTYYMQYDWCMVLKTDPPTERDARFSIICNSHTVTSMSSLPQSTPHVVSESTTTSSEMKTTSLELTLYQSSPLPITEATAAKVTVTSAFPLTSDSTGESQSSYHTTSDTTPLITNLTSSESKPRTAFKDIHIVIIVVGSTCLLLAATTVSVIYCFVCRRAKGTHSYESNALADKTNLHSTHDYKNITNQKSCDLEIINQMYVPADDIDLNPTNPRETITDDRYADVSEITVKRNPDNDKRVVNSVSNESNQGIDGHAEIHESGISEADVDPQYAVVQKNMDTDSKAKKVSFSDQDLPEIPVESTGTDNLYAQVNKKSEQRK